MGVGGAGLGAPPAPPRRALGLALASSAGAVFAACVTLYLSFMYGMGVGAFESHAFARFSSVSEPAIVGCVPSALAVTLVSVIGWRLRWPAAVFVALGLLAWWPVGLFLWATRPL